MRLFRQMTIKGKTEQTDLKSTFAEATQKSFFYKCSRYDVHIYFMLLKVNLTLK